MKIKNLNNWIKKQKKISDMLVSKVNIIDTKGWILNNKKIYNKKKNFFSIAPFSFNINKKKFWNQPLIVQKEVGILGILKRKYTIKYSINNLNFLNKFFIINYSFFSMTLDNILTRSSSLLNIISPSKIFTRDL